MPWVRFMIPSPLFDTLIEFEMHVIHSIHRSRFSIALYLEGNHVPSPRFRVIDTQNHISSKTIRDPICMGESEELTFLLLSGDG